MRLPVKSLVLVTLAAACVPPGNSTPSDSGAPTSAVPPTTARPAPYVLSGPFEDNFERTPVRRPITPAFASFEAGPTEAGADAATKGDAASKRDSGGDAAVTSDGGEPLVYDIGPNWRAASPNIWRIENGKLCGQNAKNRGIWLTKGLPLNARIEFDAVSDSPLGDLKAEVWGDGQSGATTISYTNATSYLIIFGGWKNLIHALARIDEHGKDRKEIHVDKTSDDPREKPVVPGQTYHFKIERADGKTVRWYIDGLEMLTFNDSAPLSGPGHEFFGFNDWEAKVCFDNVKVVPLPAP